MKICRIPGKSVNFGRHEVQIVRRYQSEYRTVQLAVESRSAAFGMNMAVAAHFNAVITEQFQNFRAFISLILGRIVQKSVFFTFTSRFQRCLKAEALTGQDLFVVAVASLLLIEPAAGAADGNILIFKKIIVKNIY